MTPEQLKRIVRNLSSNMPYALKLNRVIGIEESEARAWYRDQKEHWEGWLQEIRGPGFYNRKKGYTSAEAVYNKIVKPPMLLWLAEASGVPKSQLNRAIKAAASSKPAFPSWCAAIRKVIPWDDIEGALNTKFPIPKNERKR